MTETPRDGQFEAYLNPEVAKEYRDGMIADGWSEVKGAFYKDEVQVLKDPPRKSPGKKGFWSNGSFWEFDYDEVGTIVGSHEIKKEEE